MKRIPFVFELVLALALAGAGAVALGSENGGSCKEFHCHKAGEKEKRSSCLRERAACLKNSFNRKLAKWMEEGMPESKKSKIIEHMNKRIEKLRQKEKLIQEQIKGWESSKKDVEGIKINEGGKPK